MSRTCRAFAAFAAVLVAVLVPLVPAAPAAAADCPSGAQSEASTPPLVAGCDDVTPPETTLTAVNPAPNAQGYVRSKTVTFTFTGAYTDEEATASPAHPIGFECQLYNTVTAPDAWQECHSGTFTSPELQEFTAVPYTFRVRAIDRDDDAIGPCDGVPICDVSDAPDKDQTPATTTIRVDTVAPNTFITRSPVDNVRPDWPVTETASPQLVLNSNEASTYQCTLNGVSVACAEGLVILRNLAGGSKTFVARAVDRAGNLDPTPSTTRFFVPADVEKSRRSGWKRVKAGGYFGNDYLTATKVGATLKIKGQRGVREVRLLAPAGPRLGKLQVRVGDSQWYTVNLRAKSSVQQKTYLVRSHFTPLQSGTIQIRVKTLPNGGSVAVDALVARN